MAKQCQPHAMHAVGLQRLSCDMHRLKRAPAHHPRLPSPYPPTLPPAVCLHALCSLPLPAAVGRGLFVNYRFTDRRLSCITNAPWQSEPSGESGGNCEPAARQQSR